MFWLVWFGCFSVCLSVCLHLFIFCYNTGQDHRIKTKPSNIKQSEFTVDVGTWVDSKVYGCIVSWLAYVGGDTKYKDDNNNNNNNNNNNANITSTTTTTAMTTTTTTSSPPSSPDKDEKKLTGKKKEPEGVFCVLVRV